MLQRWKKAVIHLECITDKEFLDQRIKHWDELIKKHKSGEISTEELALGFEETEGRDLRYHGTAIFLNHDERRYLVTARHVIEDVELKSLPEHIRDFASMQVFNIIFRVPALDELLQNNIRMHRKWLMNLGAGPTDCAPYTFSRPEVDLAIISLNQRDSEFADEIESLGYIPIELGDILQQPSTEGVEVFTVGFPEATAILGEVNQPPAIKHWSSSYISLPTFVFGKVSMLHEKLPYFWCDMSIYPGNSGGPVIENDKLVGVVSGQPAIPAETLDDRWKSSLPIGYRIPFGKIIKAKYITNLLNAQIQKDSLIEKHRMV